MADPQQRPIGGTSPDPVLPILTGYEPADDGIVYGTAPVLPLPPNIANLQMPTNGGPYLGWGETITWDTETGLAANAIAETAGAPQDVVRVHAGKPLKVVHGVAIRAGAHPSVTPISQATNDVLVRKRVVTFSRAKLPDGSNVYGVTWLYIYELQVPPALTDSLQFSQPPFDVGSADALNPADYMSYVNPPAITTAYSIPAITF